MNQAVNLSPDQSQQVIYSYLRTKYNLPDAISKIITGQSGHETNGWTSNVYLKDNNAFGYGYDGAGNYTFYPYGIEDSIDDLVGWLDRHSPGYENITDPGVYAQALKDHGYYTDSVSNYAAGVSRWINNNLALAAGLGLAGIIGIGILIYLLLKSK